jgi:hypothetical protein
MAQSGPDFSPGQTWPSVEVKCIEQNLSWLCRPDTCFLNTRWTTTASFSPNGVKIVPRKSHRTLQKKECEGQAGPKGTQAGGLVSQLRNL